MGHPRTLFEALGVTKDSGDDEIIAAVDRVTVLQGKRIHELDSTLLTACQILSDPATRHSYIRILTACETKQPVSTYSQHEADLLPELCRRVGFRPVEYPRGSGKFRIYWEHEEIPKPPPLIPTKVWRRLTVALVVLTALWFAGRWARPRVETFFQRLGTSLCERSIRSTFHSATSLLGDARHEFKRVSKLIDDRFGRMSATETVPYGLRELVTEDIKAEHAWTTIRNSPTIVDELNRATATLRSVSDAAAHGPFSSELDARLTAVKGDVALSAQRIKEVRDALDYIKKREQP